MGRARPAGRSGSSSRSFRPAPADLPTAARSAFAGKPLLVSPERLVEEGLLAGDALSAAPAFAEGRLDGAAASRWKGRRLRESFERFEAAPPAEIAREFDAFRSAPEQSSWLDDWTLFAALSERFASRRLDPLAGAARRARARGARECRRGARA